MICQNKIVTTPSTVKRSSTHFSQERLRGGVVIFFTKVQKGHRVIKLYVRNFAKKELMELSDLFVPAGSRTLFDLVLVKFLQFSLRSKRYSLTSHPQLASRELSKEISSTHLSQESVRGYGLQNGIHQDSKSVLSFQF